MEELVENNGTQEALKGTPEHQAETGKEAPAIDYEKIQQMLTGTLKAKEETALKAFFKEQGLNQDEVKQAISDFKDKRKENEPNYEDLTRQLEEGRQKLREANLQLSASKMREELGVGAKSMPYILKLVDRNVYDGDGNVIEDTLKANIQKVLDDVPGFKLTPKPEQQPTKSTLKVGAEKGQDLAGKNAENELRKKFGLKAK